MGQRRARRDLTREKILASAAALIETHGVEALTMRRLAADLGIEAMSLYNHVANKGELLEAVAERLVGQVVLPEPTGDWRADVCGYATAFRTTALASPKVTGVLLSRQMFTSNILRIAEELLRMLQQGGLDARASVLAGRLILTHLAGTLVRELPQEEALGGDILRTRRTLLEASGLPTVAASAEYLAKPTGDEEFQFGLNLIIMAFEQKGSAD